MSQRGGRALFLAHRDEPLQQAASKLHHPPALDTGLVKPSADEHGKQTVLASGADIVPCGVPELGESIPAALRICQIVEGAILCPRPVSSPQIRW